MAKKRPSSSKTSTRTSRFSARQLLVFIIIFGAVGGLVIWRGLAAPRSGSTGGKTPITSLGVGFKDLQYPVEQQSPNFFDNNCGGNPSNTVCDPSTWVKNPTGCIWDVDDALQASALGILAAGSKITNTQCMIDDGLRSFGHFGGGVAASVFTSSPSLKATLSSDKGFSQDLTMVQTGKNAYQYVLCRADDTLGPYPTIPDSNGGYGIVVNYTLNVTNPTTHDARDTTILLTMNPNRYLINPGCPTA